MTRPPMTTQQKYLRKVARQRGRRALRAIRFACYPVYDEDEAFWTAQAILHARAAWRYALQAQTPIAPPAPSEVG